MEHGVHDLGGAAGYGPVPHEPNEPPFHADWERRVFGLLGAVTGASAKRPGEFRYALERLAPDDYFGHGYYGRWLAGFELLLAEYGVVSPEELSEGWLAESAARPHQSPQRRPRAVPHRSS